MKEQPYKIGEAVNSDLCRRRNDRSEHEDLRNIWQCCYEGPVHFFYLCILHYRKSDRNDGKREKVFKAGYVGWSGNRRTEYIYFVLQPESSQRIASVHRIPCI